MKFSLDKIGIEPDHIARQGESHHGVGWFVASWIVLTADLSPCSEHLEAGRVPGLVYLGDGSHLVQDLNRLSAQPLTLSIITIIDIRPDFYNEISGQIWKNYFKI